MHHALALAQRGLGRVSPNPSVGCVIVDESGHIVGRGWTQPGGRPHAEAVALAEAGGKARGATAYVTLEPCAHQGQTPPCANALVQAGVKRVVAALGDPDARVNGTGFKILRDAGIEVVSGVLETEAARLNEGFLKRVRDGRPLVTLKIAQSLDGKTATASGQSKWITNEESRLFGHLLRAQNDAILVGIDTVLSDDPMLDCRIPGLEDRSPIRIVLDTKARLPAASRIAQSSKKFPTLLFTSTAARADLSVLGVEHMSSQLGSDGRIDMAAMLKALAHRGVTRLLVEGGARVHASFLSGGLADRLEVFTAPIVLGGDARGAAAAIGLSDISQAPHFERTGRRRIGSDLLESFARKA